MYIVLACILFGLSPFIAADEAPGPVSVVVPVPGTTFGVSDIRGKQWFELLDECIREIPDLTLAEKKIDLDFEGPGYRADYFIKADLVYIDHRYHYTLLLTEIETGVAVHMVEGSFLSWEKGEEALAEGLANLAGPETVPTGDTGTLILSSYPSGAHFFINGRYGGRTPLRIHLPPGRYEGLLVAEGYRYYVSLFPLQAGSTLTMSPVMESIENPLIRNFDYTDYLFTPSTGIGVFASDVLVSFPVYDALFNHDLPEAPRHSLPVSGLEVSWYRKHWLTGLRLGIPFLENPHTLGTSPFDPDSAGIWAELLLSPMASVPLRFYNLTVMPSFQVGLQFLWDATLYPNTGDTLDIRILSGIAGGEFYVYIPDKDNESSWYIKLGAYAGFPFIQEVQMAGSALDLVQFATDETKSWDGTSYWWPTAHIFLSVGRAR